MKIKNLSGSLALAGCLLMAATGIGEAQLLGGADLGSTAPVPSPYDISQLLTTGDTTALPDSANLNNFYDNTSPTQNGGGGYVGSSFSTSGNAAGYKMNSLAYKFGGGGGSGNPGYSGGNDTTLAGGWIITLYQLSGTGNTNATPVYTNTVGTLTGTGNTGADWIQITGFTNTLLPNTTYAWTIFQPNGYDDLAYATGTPYGGGAICRIQPGGGAVTYFPADHDSATFNVGLALVPSPLTVTDLGTGVNPTPGANDIAQVLTTGGADGTSGINYYDNNNDQGTPGASGSSFVTGSNGGGYTLNSIALKFDGSSAGGTDTAGSQSWRITIFQLSGTGNSTATPIITNTSISHATSSAFSKDWINFSGFGLHLNPNTAYAYVITTSSSPGYTGYDDLGVYPGLPYTNGAVCRIPAGGGTVTYYPADNNSASFDINISLNGYPAASAPTAAPNPVYALSQYLVLQDIPSGPGTLTYQWQTDGGSGGALTNIPGATGLSYSNVPANLFPGGSDYNINYDFVVANGAGSVTSSVVAVTVHAATAPVIAQDISPTGPVVTYKGGIVTFTASFIGTQPITYQWFANTNGSNLAMAGQTNATLTLSNIQASAAGTYQLKAINSQGNTFSSAATVTVTANPPDYPPVPSTAYPYEVYTNGPVAYWRLNETGNPATATSALQAFDYSGHGVLPTYGTAVVTSQPGPQGPTFPGFETTNLAVATTTGGNGFLTVPPLNLNTNTVTFICWINPNGAQGGATGLLFSRGGPEQACGFGFNSANSGVAGGMAQLGYTWSTNASATWGWNSGLYPLPNQWNFVAYVVTPTNTTIYLGYINSGANTTNFLQSVLTTPNTAQGMNGGTVALGADVQQNREFNGTLDEAALFNKALSKTEILKLFDVGFGVNVSIAPTPALITSKSVYSGAQVQLGGAAGGSDPITYRWQAGVTGSGVFTNLVNAGNISGATNATLVISSISTNNAGDYWQICSNSAGSVTGNVATVSVTLVPPGGLWTVNFQLTNNVLGFATSASGLGQYAGAGVLGGGTFWNPIPDTIGEYTGGTYTSASDLRGDGVTHSGISATVNGGGNSTAASSGSPTAVSTLLDQYVTVNNSVAANGGGLILRGVPDGTYNMAIYGINGGFESAGAYYNVYGANGTQSASLANMQDQYFSPGDNSWLFTNVHVTGGSLLTDIGVNTGGSAIFNGVQLQLVSYDPPLAGFSGTPTSGTAPLLVVFTNTSAGSTNWTWNFGDGSSLTSTNASVTHTYNSGGNFTVILTANGPLGANSLTNAAYVSVTGPIMPVFGKSVLSGGNLILSGFNGSAGTQYRILSSTNVALPLANWTPVWTNVFASDGTYSYTNSSLTNTTKFFRLVSP
jgi:concanavalin A-like lectin/glucanase superfamily protein/PKD domain-containing protein/immunoglobulin I-set domain protein